MAQEFYTISHQQQRGGTKYYLTAKGSNVTLEENVADRDTKLWKKEVVFCFLSSKSKPKCVLVDQSNEQQLPATDGLIYIQRQRSGTELLFVARTGDQLPTGTWKMKPEGATQEGREFFTISQQQPSGTKYYLTASGRNVTGETKKAQQTYFDPTQLWEKKEAFSLFSKSKPDCALVEQQSTVSAESQIVLGDKDKAGLWTESDDLGPQWSGFINIQKAIDPKLVFVANLQRNVELQSIHGAMSRWKMELWEGNAQGAIGATASLTPDRTNPGMTDNAPGGPHGGGGPNAAGGAQAVPR